MKNQARSTVRRALLVTSALFGTLAPAVAMAQETPQSAGEDGASEEIIVTGTLVQNPNLVSSSPVAVVGAEEFDLRQSNNAEQVLREVPGVVASLGANTNNGTNGTATVDLRGLGSNRNIVLLDAVRLVPSATTGQVDLNILPLALIDRVDVLTGGASTSYGADAVSGVVNFVTRRDFAGLDASVSEQLSERGDTNVLRADVTIGANFDDGRGNAVLSIGYQEADSLFFAKRDPGIFTINSITGLSAGDSQTSVPTVFAFNDNSTLQVSPTGSNLVPFYQGFNFNPFNVYVTPFERFNIFAKAHYDVSDTVTAYTRALFSKHTVAGIIAPSGVFGEALTIPANNPFLNAAIRDQICLAESIPLGAACNTNAALPLPAVYRRTVELGPRTSTYVSEVFDYTAGLKVNITDNIKADIYGSYGETSRNETRTGYVARSRLQQALNATNVTTCAVTTNGCVPLNLFGPQGSITAAQAGFIGGVTSSILNTSSLAQVHGIVSGDLGFSSPWAAEPIAFAVGSEYRRYKAARAPDNLAQVPGELGGAGGAVRPLSGGFDVKEAFGELIVPLVADKPFFNELTIEAGVRHSKYKVDAVGDPSFSATTYKFGANWEPVEGLKLRGNYQRAVRAPNIGELFAPVATGLTNLAVDPCAGAGPTTNANLALACINQGAPAAAVAAGTIQNPVAGQANSTGGGNPNLGTEKATTYTFGAVIQPSGLVNGLTVSIDYYNIKITDAITPPTPGDVIFACFGNAPFNITAAQANSAACTGIRRSTVNGRLSGSPATVAGLPTPLTNAGLLKTDGIDLNINYKTDLGFAGLNLNFNGNYTRSSKFAASPTTAFRECVSFYSANCGFSAGQIQPKFSFNQRTTLNFDDIDVSLLWRHIDGVKYEPGLPVLFNGAVTGTGPLVGRSFNFNRISAYDYFDLTARFHLTDNFALTMSAFNLFDKKPPVVGGQAGTTNANSGNTFPSIYDVVGRRYAVTGRLKF